MVWEGGVSVSGEMVWGGGVSVSGKRWCGEGGVSVSGKDDVGRECECEWRGGVGRGV